MIFVNFKSYKQSAGKKGLDMAKICQEVSQETGVPIIPCVQTADLGYITKQVNIEIWAQHFDLVETERNTGFVTAYSLVQAGAKGVLINHSEHRVDEDKIPDYINKAKDNNLKNLVFTDTLDLAFKVDKYEPDYLFLETPKLIAKEAMVNFPEEREKIIKFTSSVRSFSCVGAGISSAKDVKESLQLGVKGIAFSSAFVLSENPKEVLLNIASGFKK